MGATYGVYKEKCDTKARLLEENVVIEEQKKALLEQIAKEQGDMSQYHERQSKCAAEKADLDIAEIEMTIAKLEHEKTSRDHTIKSLNDEITNQDEIINKLNKEKKHLADTGAKSSDELQGATDKVDHLNKIKHKLESTLDELESSVEKEKRSRTVVEKERRKVEGELKKSLESETT